MTLLKVYKIPHRSGQLPAGLILIDLFQASILYAICGIFERISHFGSNGSIVCTLILATSFTALEGKNFLAKMHLFFLAFFKVVMSASNFLQPFLQISQNLKRNVEFRLTVFKKHLLCLISNFTLKYILIFSKFVQSCIDEFWREKSNYFASLAIL